MSQILTSRKTRIKTPGKPPTTPKQHPQILTSRKTRIKTILVVGFSDSGNTQILTSRKTRIKTFKNKQPGLALGGSDSNFQKNKD